MDTNPTETDRDREAYAEREAADAYYDPELVGDGVDPDVAMALGDDLAPTFELELGRALADQARTIETLTNERDAALLDAQTLREAHDALDAKVYGVNGYVRQVAELKADVEALRRRAVR